MSSYQRDCEGGAIIDPVLGVGVRELRADAGIAASARSLPRSDIKCTNSKIKGCAKARQLF